MDAFDNAFVIAREITEFLQLPISIVMFTDSKQLFDAMTKGKRTTEKRLMIDILSARESQKRFKIRAVGFVKGINNPADSLTTCNGNDTLSCILQTGIEDTKVERWIHRSDAITSKALIGRAV